MRLGRGVPAALGVGVVALALVVGLAARDGDELLADLPGTSARVAFTHGDDILVVDADGRRVARIDDAAHPSWSPDGTMLAFERPAPACVRGPGGQCADDIWVVRADGTDERPLVRRPGEDHEPAWSPDGRRILFVSWRGRDNPDIWVMQADGSDARRLVARRPHDRDAAWSPDGRWIAFSSGPPDGSADIWVMRADGTAVRPLTRSPNRHDTEPDWSPDGRSLVFASSGELWMMDIDGSDQRALTRRVLEDDPFDDEPDWSPNGRWLVFEREIETDEDVWGLTPTRSEIWLMDAEGGNLGRLTNGEDSDPKWRPRLRAMA